MPVHASAGQNWNRRRRHWMTRLVKGVDAPAPHARSSHSFRSFALLGNDADHVCFPFVQHQSISPVFSTLTDLALSPTFRIQPSWISTWPQTLGALWALGRLSLHSSTPPSCARIARSTLSVFTRR